MGEPAFMWTREVGTTSSEEEAQKRDAQNKRPLKREAMSQPISKCVLDYCAAAAGLEAVLSAIFGVPAIKKL